MIAALWFQTGCGRIVLFLILFRCLESSFQHCACFRGNLWCSIWK